LCAEKQAKNLANNEERMGKSKKESLGRSLHRPLNRKEKTKKRPKNRQKRKKLGLQALRKKERRKRSVIKNKRAF